MFCPSCRQEQARRQGVCYNIFRLRLSIPRGDFAILRVGMLSKKSAGPSQDGCFVFLSSLPQAKTPAAPMVFGAAGIVFCEGVSTVPSYTEMSASCASTSSRRS